jgi:hypothetical protein
MVDLPMVAALALRRPEVFAGTAIDVTVPAGVVHVRMTAERAEWKEMGRCLARDRGGGTAEDLTAQDRPSNGLC